MSNQRKYFVAKNDYHPGKVFGFGSHSQNLSEYALRKMESFLDMD